jgi:uncharacterized repeat protein (TIGR03806 family)
MLHRVTVLATVCSFVVLTGCDRRAACPAPPPPQSGITAAASAVLVLPLDEGARATAFDASGFANHGTVTGTPLWAQGGLVLDGVDQHVRVPHAPRFALRQLSLAAWVKPDRLREWDGIVSWGVTAAPWTLQLGSNGRLRFVANAKLTGERAFDSSGSLALGRWQHVAITYDGARVRFWRDGVLDPNQPSAQITFGTIAEPVTVGAHLPYGNECLQGALRDVRVYDGALTAAEVASLAGDSLVPRALGAFLGGRLPPRTPGGGGPITIAPAFRNLTFDDPLVIRPAPNSNRLWVGSRQGVIHSFVNDSFVSSKQLFLDLSDRCAEVWDGGFLGLAFHPQFGVPGSASRGYFYVYYCWTPTPNYRRDYAEGFFGVYLRLSRFNVPDGSLAADKSSESVMLHLRLYNGSHRGGDIAFGPDGFLYVPVGDQFRYDTAQRIDDNLEGGVLRLDVDRNASRSHAPRRALPLAYAEEISGRNYWIPNDNPFLDPLGAIFEEYFSVGHRNPHRLTFDAQTGRIWSGEVGENEREEINVVEKGRNYGWPFREGLIAGNSPPPSRIWGTVTDPVVDFQRTEANAIIGGYVYRGSEFPELAGKFLCGDHRQMRLWALTYDQSRNTAQKEALATFEPGELATFGQDHQGRIYLGGLGKGVPIHTLARAGGGGSSAPQLLSQTGAFRDVRTLDPASGVVPYDLRAPFWSDGARKRRWIAVPNDGAHDTPAETIVFDERGDWTFPAGTVLVKHFELPTDERDPAALRRLETRLLVCADDGSFYGLTYRWRADNSDADLLAGAQQEDITVRTAAGGTRTQRWSYPSPTDCRNCHLDGAGGVLGPRTHQLNGEFAYPGGRTENQLRAWSRLGLFRTAIDASAIASLPGAAAAADATASLEERARSYLDSNCASCHRPQTGNRAQFDARLGTPLASQGLLGGLVLDDLGISGARLIAPRDPDRSIVWRRMNTLGATTMPPLARNALDDAGVELVRQWIWSLAAGARAIALGRAIADQPSVDSWWHSLVIDQSATFTNTTGAPLELRIAAFRFHARQASGPLTPFVARVVGTDSFVVAAVGTPRTEAHYRAGANVLAFRDGAEPIVVVQPGETLAAGFLDALPDGSGGTAGGVVPYCACNGARVWRSGGTGSGDSARIVAGAPPTPGARVVAGDQRGYAFAIDLCECASAERAVLGNAPGELPQEMTGAWNVAINESDVWVNDSSTARTVAVESFAFEARNQSDSVTPFVVRLDAGGLFTMRAVGTTRAPAEYARGANHFAFHRYGPYPIVVAPGERIAAGVLDGRTIPFSPGSDTTWRLGSDTLGPQRQAANYAFGVRLRLATIGPQIALGNADDRAQLDSWTALAIVAHARGYTNTTGAPQRLHVHRFRFQARTGTGPLTPFLVKVRGANDFRVAAIGTTRAGADYRAGANLLPFLEGGPAEIVLGPGETLAPGFLAAAADGSGAQAAAIPYASGSPVWRSGGSAAADTARIAFGQPPLQGKTARTDNRDYAFAIDLTVQ